MAKLKKTRQQKIKADLRKKQQYSLGLSSNTGELFTFTPTSAQQSDKIISPVNTTSTGSINTQHYKYLTHDLRKTTLVTILIVVAQLVLRIFVFK